MEGEGHMDAAYSMVDWTVDLKVICAGLMQ